MRQNLGPNLAFFWISIFKVRLDTDKDLTEKENIDFIMRQTRGVDL